MEVPLFSWQKKHTLCGDFPLFKIPADRRSPHSWATVPLPLRERCFLDENAMVRPFWSAMRGADCLASLFLRRRRSAFPFSQTEVRGVFFCSTSFLSLNSMLQIFFFPRLEGRSFPPSHLKSRLRAQYIFAYSFRRSGDGRERFFSFRSRVYQPNRRRVFLPTTPTPSLPHRDFRFSLRERKKSLSLPPFAREG